MFLVKKSSTPGAFLSLGKIHINQICINKAIINQRRMSEEIP
jgi:hypothetical protein